MLKQMIQAIRQAPRIERPYRLDELKPVYKEEVIDGIHMVIAPETMRDLTTREERQEFPPVEHAETRVWALPQSRLRQAFLTSGPDDTQVLQW